MPLRMSSLIALRSLRRNRLQSVLTILSLTIGVATVIAMLAVGRGAERSIMNQVRAAGMNILVVTSGNFNAARPWLSSQVEEPPLTRLIIQRFALNKTTRMPCLGWGRRQRFQRRTLL